MTDTKTVTLAEFLLARIAEDEADARVAGEWLRADDAYNDDVLWSVADGRNPEPFLGHRVVGRHFEHIARHDPARVLAECDAKRNAVGYARSCKELTATHGGAMASGMSAAAHVVVRLLASVYADHPDYQPEWRP